MRNNGGSGSASDFDDVLRRLLPSIPLDNIIVLTHYKQGKGKEYFSCPPARREKKIGMDTRIIILCGLAILWCTRLLPCTPRGIWGSAEAQGGRPAQRVLMSVGQASFIKG